VLHSVVQVIPTKDFKVFVYFEDGKIKLFDMSSLLTSGVFKQISDINTFIEKCTVINHTLAWDVGGNFDPYKCIDMDPEAIYSAGVDVADPMKDRAA
jgi:hypothetical protein